MISGYIAFRLKRRRNMWSKAYGNREIYDGFPKKTIKPLAVDFSGVGVLERYWMLKSQRCGLRNKAKTAKQDRRMFEWIMS